MQDWQLAAAVERRLCYTHEFSQSEAPPGWRHASASGPEATARDPDSSVSKSVGNLAAALHWVAMTTREYLRARVIRLYVWSTPVVVGILALAVWGRRSSLLNGAVFLAVAAYVTAYIVFMRATQCLRCAAPLKGTALNWGARRQPVPTCASCGLSIDEPVADRQ
jgi:hypothetical protein